MIMNAADVNSVLSQQEEKKKKTRVIQKLYFLEGELETTQMGAFFGGMCS